MSHIERLMFREYDLRGRVDNGEMDENAEVLLGKAFATTLLRKKITDTMVIGHDFREYSPRLKDAFVQGVLATGMNVIDIGMCLTPMLYFAQYHFKTIAGAMITASHNDNGWTGVKFADGYTQTLLSDGLMEIYDLIQKDDFETGNGTVRTDSITKPYLESVVSKVRLARPLRVVIECGNGTAGAFALEIFRSLGCEVFEQYCDLDATFPHYTPNPEKQEEKKVLADRVLKEKADIGLGFDGDGDRLGVVDENGKNIWSDRLLILLARQVLAKHPGSKIVFDVKCTQALPEDIIAHGGVPIMWKTGHSYIKKKTREEDAMLGGERSGHFFIRDEYYGFDDAIFAAARLLEYLSSETQSFSQLIAQTPSYVISPTIHIDCADAVKYDVVERLTAELKKRYGSENVNDVNGARVQFEDGWGLVRPSSNEPVLVVVVESKTAEGVEKIKNIFKTLFAEYPEIGKVWHNE